MVGEVTFALLYDRCHGMCSFHRGVSSGHGRKSMENVACACVFVLHDACLEVYTLINLAVGGVFKHGVVPWCLKGHVYFGPLLFHFKGSVSSGLPSNTSYGHPF